MNVQEQARPSWLTELLRNHPALLLTASYILLIFIGVIYEAFLFLRFRVNVLFYADAADFVLVPFREPLVMLVSVAPIPLWFLYIALVRLILRRIPRLRQKDEEWHRRRSMPSGRAAAVLAIALWSVAFSAHYARIVARQIRAGEVKPVRVEPSSGGAPVTGPLLGTTARFVFVYDRATMKTHAIPVENIARVVLDSPPRRSDQKLMMRAAPSSSTSPAP